MLKIDGVTHWSIPVNDLEESERFYRDLLGLEYRGRLGNSNMACFHVAATISCFARAEGEALPDPAAR